MLPYAAVISDLRTGSRFSLSNFLLLVFVLYCNIENMKIIEGVLLLSFLFESEKQQSETDNRFISIRFLVWIVEFLQGGGSRHPCLLHPYRWGFILNLLFPVV
jgi:hypothetical protein